MNDDFKLQIVNDDSECQGCSSERQKCGNECPIMIGWWLWMKNYEKIVTLNTKLKRDGGSECPNWEEMVALDAQTEKGWWL